MAPKIKTMHQALIFLDCRGQVREISRAGGKYARKLVWKFVFLKAYHIQLQPLPPRELEQMCARYRLMIDWQLSPHLVSGESTLHQVTRFKARSRIFLPVAQSWAALFCCRLAILASSLGWLVGNNSFILFYTPPPPPASLKAQYEFWLFETGLILYRQKYSKIAEKMASYRLSHCFHNNLLLRFFDWIARIKLRFIRKSFFQVVWKKKKQ